ncbi:unnamed protein product [Peronospora belbahrii]|uniref:Uncharacterized protein n=1 Tax=Peronospora belbahrii TaxID=622444 RepID=A0AAU9KUS3_9STRA|nr:unnamed protein product [Peronospora belbahrii]
MDPPPRREHLPSANVALFAFQTAIGISVFLLAPDVSWLPLHSAHAGSGASDSSGSVALASSTIPTASTLMPTNPLSPPVYVFYIWIPIYVFSGITVITDRFYPNYSFYLTSDDPSFLRQWFQLSCLANISWVVLDKWFIWVHMATFALGVLCEFSVRLYFGWVSAGFVFGIADVMQYMHAAYFGFSVYAVLLGALLVLAFSTYVHGRDPVVGLVVMWALIGFISRHSTFSGDTEEVFEKLQAVAIVFAPVFTVLLFIDSVQYVYTVHCKASIRVPSSSNESYKSFVFETTAEYGTV